MRIFKSKKGIGTSVIADIFALLAYFIFFIVVLFLIALPSGLGSKAEIRVTSLSTDYGLELNSFLRTSIPADNGEIVAVSEYLAKFVDTCESGGDISYFKNDAFIIKLFHNLDSALATSADGMEMASVSRYFGSPISFVFESDVALSQDCKSVNFYRIPDGFDESKLEKLAELSYTTRKKNTITAMIVKCPWNKVV